MICSKMFHINSVLEQKHLIWFIFKHIQQRNIGISVVVLCHAPTLWYFLSKTFWHLSWNLKRSPRPVGWIWKALSIPAQHHISPILLSASGFWAACQAEVAMTPNTTLCTVSPLTPKKVPDFWRRQAGVTSIDSDKRHLHHVSRILTCYSGSFL